MKKQYIIVDNKRNKYVRKCSCETLNIKDSRGAINNYAAITGENLSLTHEISDKFLEQLTEQISEKIFKILPSYKVNRGVSYQVNRWYVEKVVIKCDSNGLFADVTLNPFPSSYSVYHNAVKSYADAYTQAFKSTSETTTSNNTTISTANNIPARTDGKTDCSSTYSLCCAHTGSSSNPSNKGYENRANAQGKIGKEGTNYAEYVKGCTPKEAYKKLAKKHNYGNYRGYSDNAHACASNTLNASVSNCGDRARLLKASMDVLGQPCVIYHVYNHYMNGVLINGRWETVDLCYQSGSMPQYQTAGWNR